MMIQFPRCGLFVVASFILLAAPFEETYGQIVISCNSTDATGCVVIYSGQGYRAGWTQADAYDNVSVSAILSSEGAAGQTGQAYLTTQIGPGTSVANQIASTNFTFPLDSSNLMLFSGLQLQQGSYYLSIIGDSPTWGSCWMHGNTTVVTGTGVTSLGAFGATAVSSYFPASPPYFDQPVPSELTITGVDVDHPQLQIAQSNSNVLISWTTNAVGFDLESSDSMNPGSWQGITQQVYAVSNNYTFATNANGAQFYRLRKQTN